MLKCIVVIQFVALLSHLGRYEHRGNNAAHPSNNRNRTDNNGRPKRPSRPVSADIAAVDSNPAAARANPKPGTGPKAGTTERSGKK